MKSYQQFFAELKRRQVFKVAALYGFVSFGVLQAADLMLPRLGVPDWTVTFMVALVVLAFPVVLIMAWAFEVTDAGVKRTDAAGPGEIESMIAEPASRRWPAGLLALAGLAALLAGAWWVGRRSGAASAASEPGARAADVQLAYADPRDDGRPSIAVLPFDDMSPQGDQEYFSDGMAEEILNVLAKVRELRVAARTSAFAFKNHELTAEQLGDTLRVGYLVEGSVRKAGDRLRITAQLIDTSDGSHLWSEQYDRDLEDVFAIQTEIAEAIAEALRVPLGLGGDASFVTPTGDLTAYDLYLAGRAQMRLRGEGLREAVALFDAAIARDSNWAPAWASLAETSEIAIWHASVFLDEADDYAAFVDSAQSVAEHAALRALELDPRNASALVALGSVQRNRAEWEASEASYRRALALDPDNAEAHQQYADLMYNVGRIDEAVAAADRAWALDPAPIRAEALGWALWLDGRLEESADVFARALEDAPASARERLLSNAIFAAMLAGRAEVALEYGGEWARLQPDFDATAFESDMAVADSLIHGIIAGDLTAVPLEARGIFRGRPDLWMQVGRPDSALAEFDAFRSPIIGRTAEAWLPALDPIRSDPIVQEFLAERGLAGVTVRRTPIDDRRRPILLREDSP